MSLRTPRNAFNTREPGCAGRARRASILAPRIAATDTAVASAGAPAPAGPAISAPAPTAQILRRWSVAELIAQATWPAELA